MKILHVGGLSNEVEARNSLARIAELLMSAGEEVHAEVESIYLDKIIFKVNNSGIQLLDSVRRHELSADLVFVRGPRLRQNSTLIHHISRFCHSKNITCVNDRSAYFSGSKFAQLIHFYEHRAPILTTLYCFNNNLLIDVAEKEFGYPYILKSNLGSHGDSNYLISNMEEARKALKDEPTVSFIAQEYCQNDRDYRVLLAGEQYIVFERRGAANSHLNNTSKGGSAALVKGVLPQACITLAHQVSSSLGMTLAGVDIVPKLGTNDYYFLEINSQPQLVTGALLTEKKQLLSRLLRTLA